MRLLIRRMANPNTEPAGGRALFFLVFLFFWPPGGALPSSGYAQAGARWPDYGRLLADPNLFPLVIWLQQPSRAAAYRELGINLYIGLWKGPTASQLAALKRAAMPVVAEQNDVGLTDPNADVIIAWMHQDEPDNAQKRQDGLGYGPPVTPAEIVERYQAMRARDPSRPVLLASDRASPGICGRAAATEQTIQRIPWNI